MILSLKLGKPFGIIRVSLNKSVDGLGGSGSGELRFCIVHRDKAYHGGGQQQCRSHHDEPVVAKQLFDFVKEQLHFRNVSLYSCF